MWALSLYRIRASLPSTFRCRSLDQLVGAPTAGVILSAVFHLNSLLTRATFVLDQPIG